MDLGTSQAERSPSDTDGRTDTATPANGTPSGRRRLVGPLTVRRQPTSMAVLLVAAFGAFLAFLDSTIVNIAFPNIQKSFPTYTISLSWILNAYNIVFAAFLVAAGKLADLLGRTDVAAALNVSDSK
jgi:NTE family protein